MRRSRLALRVDTLTAWRGLIHARLYVVATATVLGLGLGAVLMVLVLRHHLIEHPYAFPAADRVAVLSEVNARDRGRLSPASPASVAEWRTALPASLVSALAAARAADVHLKSGEEVERARAAFVTEEFFALLGARPVAGRLLSAQDYGVNAEESAVLSEREWKRRFAADRSLVGRVVTLDGRPTRIQGVLADEFVVPRDAAVYLPLRLPASTATDRVSRSLLVIALLRAPSTRDALQERVAALARQNERRFAATNAGWSVMVSSLAAYYAGQLRAFVTILLSVVLALGALVLVNASAAMLARASQQTTGLAIRAALGASGPSLAMLPIIEGAIIGCLGGIIAVPVAALGLRAWREAPPAYLSEGIPGWSSLSLSGAEGVLAVVAGVCTGCVCSGWPAIVAGTSDLARSLGSRRAATNPHHARWRRRLVAAEVALAFALVTTGALMVAALRTTLNADLGFSDRGAWTSVVAVPAQSDTGLARDATRLLTDLRERLRHDPAITSVGAASELPLSWSTNTIYYSRESEGLDVAHSPSAITHSITAGYVGAAGIRLLHGRDVAPSDTAGAPAVVLLNASLANRAFGTPKVVGRRLLIGGSPRTIVGVVADTRHIPMSQRPSPELFIPLHQAYGAPTVMHYIVQFAPPGVSSAARVREIVRRAADDVGAGLAIDETRPLATVVHEAIAPERALAVLLSSFAVLALLVAALGVYAVTAYVTGLRMPEFAVRSALGASPGAITGLIFRDTTRMLAWGLAGGAVLSAAVARLLASVLPELPVTSLAVWLLIGLGLATSVFVATIGPAWRASHTPPWLALRTG